MRAAALLLILLVPSAAAWAEEPVRGGLVFPEGARMEGSVRVEARGGALDLSLLAREGRPLRLTWAGSEGYVAGEEFVTAADGSSFSLRQVNETLGGGADELVIRECGPSCEVVLIQRPASAIVLEGRVANEFAWTSASRAFAWKYNGSAAMDEPGVFYHAFPAGTLLLAPAAGVDTEATPLAGGIVRAEGDLLLFIDDATIEFGGREIHARDRSAPLADLPFAPAERRISTYAVLELEGASFHSSPGDRVVVYAGMPTVELAGTLRAPSATGSMWAGEQERRLDNEPLTITGELRLAPTTRPPSIGPLAVDDPRGHVLAAEIEGQATHARLGTQTVVNSPRTIAATGALSISLLTLLALAARLLWLPLYSRLRPSAVPSEPTRARILARLAQGEGLTTVALARELGVARAVAAHHLTMLEAHGYVTTRRTGWERRYYLAGRAPDPSDLARAAALDDPTRRRIAVHVASGARTQAEIVLVTGVPQRLVSYHLAKLERAGLVEKREGRPCRFEPTGSLLQAVSSRSKAAESS